MAHKLDLGCDQGATFSAALVWTDPDGQPVDMTGYTVRMQVRDAFADDGGTILVHKSTPSSGITWTSQSTGEFTVEIPATETELLPAGSYKYDIEAYTGSTTYRYMEGRFLVRPEVTRI